MGITVPQASRVDWVDYAKGFCIVMVVMMHSTLGVELAAGHEGWMHAAVAFARPFRMPDFFLISGLFLARVIDRDWRDYLDKKVVHFAYFYVLWVTIQFAFKAPMFAAEMGWRGVGLSYLEAFIEPFGTLWFIYLLPIFFVTVKATRGLPWWAIWLVGAALEIAHVDTGWTVIDEFAHRFVFFYTGYVFAAHVFALAARVQRQPGTALGGLAVWALINGALVLAGYADRPFVSLALAFVGAGAVVVVAALMARSDVFRPLRYCGQNSIVIYLAFFLPMAATRIALLKSGIITDLGTTSVLVTAVGVVGALAWYWAVRGTPLRFLFERPAWARLKPARIPAMQPAESSTAPPSRIDSGPLTAHIRAMPAKTTTKTKKPAAKPAAAKAAATKTSPIAGALKKGDHVFLVDGSGYIFRAYHALPPLTRKSDGLQINAVLGFCNMLWKLLNEMKSDERPTHLAVVFDKSEKTFRSDFYPQYKAHRPDVPSDLIPQFPLIRDAVKAFDIPCLEQAGFEADDLIATYARLACEAQATATIVSSDKDLMQLVNDRVTMYDTMKDKRIGPAEVVEKFGVGPEKVIEVQALIGDSTDNVPGVPGIGVKTAAQLIIEYGDLETLLVRAGEIKQDKRRQTLIDNAELARVSKRLVTLDQNVDLEVPVEDLAVHEPDYKLLIAFLKAMEFSTLTRRVAEKSGIEANEIAADSKLSSTKATAAAASPASEKASIPYGKSGDLFAPPPQPRSKAEERGDLSPATLAAAHLAAAKASKFDRGKYETVRTLDRLNAWMLRATDIGVVALDTKTTSADPMTAVLCGFSLAVADNQACYVPIGHRDGDTQGGKDLFAPEAKLRADQISEEAALAALRPVLEDPSVLKIGQDLKYHWEIFARRGIEIHPYDDTMLMSYVLDAGRGKHNMDDLAEALLGYQSIRAEQVTGTGKAFVPFDRVTIEKASEHAAEAADIALRLWKVLKARLAAEHVATVYATLEQPLISVLGRMERRGISIDRQVLSRLSGEFGQKQAGLEDEISKLAGQPLNPGSPKQLGDVLFGSMGLPGGTKTKTGQWATGARALEELAEQGHELPRKILDWRQVSKLRSTYTDALPDYVNAETHRVHTSYALAATTTGRLSSSEPNLQNIPVRTEEGRKIRRAFIADPGTKLVSADYSQIELRLLAEVAEVPALRKAFRDGLDIHAMTASEMFGVPVKDMPGEVRRRAKAINFGIIYGISAFGLANQLAIPRDEAGAYIKKYFERFPGIRDYMEETKAFAKKNGYVLTLFGRKCHYPDIAAGNPSLRAFNERAAINARLQGSAADIIRRAMVRIEPALTKAKLNAKMLLQVHDELIFEVPEGEVANTLPVVKRVMEDAPMPAVSLSVPLQVDARAAHNWDEAH